MNLKQNFTKEVKKFSAANWWVYIIYFVLLIAILFIEKEKFTSVFVITSLHFVADIFIMMMFSSYAVGKSKQGTYYQVVSMLLFMSLKIYTGFVDHSWHYLAADPVYIFAAIKNYRVDIKGFDLKFVNPKTMSLLSIILFSTLIYARFAFNASLLNTPAQWIQTAGIFLFAIALCITGNERGRSELAVVALIAMVGGSAWETANSFMSGKIVGLALSYFLLPLTVLTFYLKNLSAVTGQKKTNLNVERQVVKV